MNVSIPLSPSLPSLQSLPYFVAIDGLLGFFYGKIIHPVNPYLMASICVIRSLAQTLLFNLVNFTFKGKDLQSQKIFLATSASVNIIFFILIFFIPRYN